MNVIPKKIRSDFIVTFWLLLTCSSLNGQAQPTKVAGCDLLASPAKYNGKMVEIYGLVHTDFEHFDLRLPCDGYIQLEVSPNARTAKKFGFRTREDAEFQHLMRLVNGDKSGSKATRPEDLFNHEGSAYARLKGLFRCHYDFPDCSEISRHGDSSVVILSIESVSVEK